MGSEESWEGVYVDVGCSGPSFSNSGEPERSVWSSWKRHLICGSGRGLITRRTFLMVILLVFSLAELSPPLPPFHLEWKPPPDQIDSSLLGRSSLTGSLKDLTSTSSPNKSLPHTVTMCNPCILSIMYCLRTDP